MKTIESTDLSNPLLYQTDDWLSCSNISVAMTLFTIFDSPNKFIADRTNHRRHLGFGAGIHRCIGDGLANLQLMALWQEVLRRGLTLQLAGAPERTYSNFIRGYRSLPMVIS